MQRNVLLAVTVAFVALPAGAAADTLVRYSPQPSDLNDLDHYYAYKWGIDLALQPGESVAAAQLSFENIRNWDNAANILYTHVLDWTQSGVGRVYDNQGGGDYFETAYSGAHAHLVTYENLPSTPQDLVYTFTPGELSVLNGYLADGRIGLGFDPDCHFYNDGVELALTIVPEPAALLPLAVGVCLFRRR
ncbi:MAG: hypothetical protein AB1716_13640 [Planctomycetota bacterium]